MENIVSGLGRRKATCQALAKLVSPPKTKTKTHKEREPNKGQGELGVTFTGWEGEISGYEKTKVLMETESVKFVIALMGEKYYYPREDFKKGP